jgi:hypothetical protein
MLWVGQFTVRQFLSFEASRFFNLFDWQTIFCRFYNFLHFGASKIRIESTMPEKYFSLIVKPLAQKTTIYSTFLLDAFAWT